MDVKIIGHVETEFVEKFGVPKQPGLVPSLRGKIVLATADYAASLSGLEDCTHLWILFWFHHNKPHQHATVRPPVLGGDRRMGIFATRSPHRPTPVGLSLVRLDRIELGTKPCLWISGHDLVSGTPVIDIKPYIESYDRPREAARHWSDQLPLSQMPVAWRPEALAELEALGESARKGTIDALLALDPRPRHAKATDVFGMSFAGLNFAFLVEGETLVISGVNRAGERSKVKRSDA